MQKRCAPAASAARACSSICSGSIIACIGVSASAYRDWAQKPQSSAQPPDFAFTSEHISVESPKRSLRTVQARSTSSPISSRSRSSPNSSASSKVIRGGTVPKARNGCGRSRRAALGPLLPCAAMPRQGGSRGALVALASLLAATGALAASGDAAGGKGGPKGKGRSNVVVVMTDDQTLASMEVMPRTRTLIGGAGATFANSFASFPLCCPSRATFLTGRYAHNHKVLNNIPPLGGFARLRSAETLPVWLGRAGYYTGLIGKYLNGYEQSPVGVPPGWSEFHGQKTQNAYYGFELQEGKQRVRYGDPDENPNAPAQPETYASDVYTDKAVEFIGRRAPKKA